MASNKHHTDSASESFDDQKSYELLGQGDKSEMIRIFKEYYSRLYYFSQNLISDTSESEDIVMKALEALWQQSKSGIKVGHIEAYLFSIVRNGCYDYLKHKKVVENSIPIIGNDSDLQNRIEAALVQEDLINRVFKEIENLPGKCRDVATFIYIRGYSTLETAEALNISPSTVRSQKSRAISLLKNIFVKNGLTIFLLL